MGRGPAALLLEGLDGQFNRHGAANQNGKFSGWIPSCGG